MLIIGCDFHARTQQLAMLDTETGEVTERRLDHESGEAQKFYAGLKAQALVGIESTGYAQWFGEMLAELGHELVVGEAGKIRKMEVRKQKHDRRDAEHLLNLLLRGDFPKIWLPSAAERDVRVLVEHRHQLVEFRTRAKNGLQAMALNQGLRRRGQRWSKPGQAYLERLELNAEAAEIRDQTLVLRKTLDACIGHWDQALSRRVQDDARVRQLKTAPGVGAQTAFAYRVFVGDVHRFRHGKQVAKYFGLVPRERSSGEHRHLRPISKEGDGLMRTLLMEAALRATRQPGPLREFYRRMVRHKGKAKARVAVARKLAVILYQLWKKDLTYWEFLQREAQFAGGPGKAAGH